MEEIRNLNELNKGIHKKWIWGSEENYYRSCDYLQKINYSIQDLNREIPALMKSSMKEVIYIIVLIDWICEAVEAIFGILKEEIRNAYSEPETEDVLKSRKFFKAIRSFVVAHPLSTNRHKEYGLDGSWICVDIRSQTMVVTRAYSPNSDWFHLDFDGVKENARDQDADFVLYAYSAKKDGMKFYKYISVDFKDLYQVARYQVEKLYELDKYFV